MRPERDATSLVGMDRRRTARRDYRNHNIADVE
jgi:hypothetical protein